MLDFYTRTENRVIKFLTFYSFQNNLILTCERFTLSVIIFIKIKYLSFTLSIL